VANDARTGKGWLTICRHVGVQPMSPDQWAAVRRRLARVVAHCECSMGPSFTKRRGKTYRYYQCVHASKRGAGSCPVGTVPAGEIERAVIEQLRAVFETPEVVAATVRAAREQREVRLQEVTHQHAEATAALATLREEAQRLMSGAYGDSALVAERMTELSAQVEGQERAITQADQEMQALSSRVGEQEVIGALASLDPVFDLNLVATTAGSFVLSLDLAPRAQPPLLSEFDVGEEALEEMAGYVEALTLSTYHSEIPRAVLVGLNTLAEVLDAGVSELQLQYAGRARSFDVTLVEETRHAIRTRLGEEDLGPQTIKGIAVAIDIESKECTIHADEGPRVKCSYEDALESDLIRALGHRVEIAGQTKPRHRPIGFDITRIERFRRLPKAPEADDDET